MIHLKFIMKYRIGLDLGTNSIGWAVIKLDDDNKPIEVVDGNSRIFSDSRTPKTKTSLAVTRREARGARRNRDRFLERQKKLFKTLINYGLMPSEKEKQKEIEKKDPYYLRYKALDHALESYDLGRVLFALNQRRGFKSNRKKNKKKTSANTKLKNHREKFENTFKKSDYRTLGEYYWKEKQTPLEGDHNQKIKRVYGVRYQDNEDDTPSPVREMYEDEFEAIRKAQNDHHNLTDQQWDDLFKIIFDQRDLRAVEKGKCQLYYNDSTLDPSEKERAYKALPSAEKFRVWQDIHNLRIITDTFERLPLNFDEKKQIFEIISNHNNNTISFTKFKKILKKPNIRFNFEKKDKKSMLGMKTNVLLKKPKYFGSQWDTFDDQKKDEIVLVLLKEEKPENIKNKALSEWKVSEDQAQSISKIEIKEFESGTSRFCQKALHDLIPYMKNGFDFYEARSKLDTNTKTTQEKKLDYYGHVIPEVITNSGLYRSNKNEKETGIIGNPTVHVGLNQLRAVVNAIIDRYGDPTEINLELARDLKMNKKQKKAYENRLKKNTDKNKKIKQELKKLGIKYNYDNRLKYNLFKELGESQECIFSGKKISLSNLFTKEINVEHIIPRSRSHDDSFSNKTLCYEKHNHLKNSFTPYEAFNNNPKYDYNLILERSKRLPDNKQWRFHENSIQQFEEEVGFLKRQLHDTQYLSKVAQQYLATLFKDGRYVRVFSGKLTAKLRHDWGINKDRDNHRHHFIDAVVIGLTETSDIQKANINSKNNTLDKITYPCPIEKDLFIKQVSTISNNTIISHQYRHHKKGELHEKTYYGYENHEHYNLSHRISLKDLIKRINNKKSDSIEKFAKSIENVFNTIKDPKISNDLKKLTEKLTKKEIIDVINNYFNKYGIKSVKVFKKDNPIFAIKHNQHTKWVIPGNMHHVKLWQLPNGEIEGVGVYFYELNKPNYATTSFRPKDKKTGREIATAKYITKIHKGDLIECDYKGERVVGKITSLKPSNQCLMFTFHDESLTDPKLLKSLKFSNWKKHNCKKVNLDVLGKKIKKNV